MVLISSKLELITVSNPVLSTGLQSKGGLPVLCVSYVLSIVLKKAMNPPLEKKISSERSELGSCGHEINPSERFRTMRQDSTYPMLIDHFKDISQKFKYYCFR